MWGWNPEFIGKKEAVKEWGCSSAGEHRVRNAGVGGSNPLISTIKL